MKEGLELARTLTLGEKIHIQKMEPVLQMKSRLII